MVAVDELTVSPDAVASLDEQLEAARNHRVIRSPRGWELLGYEDGLMALRDPALMRAKLFLWRADNIELTEGFTREFLERTVNSQEGEQRKHLRTPMARLLSPRKTKTLFDDVHEIVDRALSEVADPDDVDFLREVAWRIPSETYCAMVSIPWDAAPQVARLSDSTIAPLLTMEKHRRAEMEAAQEELFELVIEHIEHRREHLSDDFTSALIEEELAGNLTRQEVYDIAVSLLTASVDNTVHQSAIIIARLLERPDSWAQLLAQPELMPNAVEEVIRMWPRFRTHIRYAAGDQEQFGAELKDDDLVFIHVVAAQHDERVFERPLEFDISRPTLPGPLLFGQGQYSCLGQHLARLEMHELLLAMMKRYPNARLLEFEEHEGPFVREVTKLRVSLTGN
tara:strand:- start:91 stop:1278 length:1188 start_codon:yes stop_codon:yes gene_type:complete